MCKKTSLIVYGCTEAEAKVFKEVAMQFEVTVVLITEDISEDNACMFPGCSCISVGHKAKVSKPMIAMLKKAGVRYISTRSVGYDHIDMQAAKNMGIAVDNTTYSPGSVADYTVMLMLMLLRNTKLTLLNAETNNFKQPITCGKELQDMTVGILGTGRIGTAVFSRLEGFGCRVLTYDRKQKSGTSFTKLLQESDVLTVHVPFSASTHHMLNGEAFEKMKQGTFLINTARGGVVDTNALVHALEKGKLAGAALDVIEGEEEFFYQNCANKFIANPYLGKLQHMENVIITPHVAYYTERAMRDTAQKTIQNCLHFERSRLYG